MYINGVKQGDTHHYELDPGQSKIISFDSSNDIDIKELVFATKYKSIKKEF
jgi:hypothetical protein